MTSALEFALALIALAIYTGRGPGEASASYALGSGAFFVVGSTAILGIGAAMYHDYRVRKPGERERTPW